MNTFLDCVICRQSDFVLETTVSVRLECFLWILPSFWDTCHKHYYQYKYLTLEGFLISAWRISCGYSRLSGRSYVTVELECFLWILPFFATPAIKINITTTRVAVPPLFLHSSTLYMFKRAAVTNFSAVTLILISPFDFQFGFKKCQIRTPRPLLILTLILIFLFYFFCSKVNLETYALYFVLKHKRLPTQTFKIVQ